MCSGQKKEKRRYERYETDMQVQFYVSFDIETKIDFRVKEQGEGKFSNEKYTAISSNVSVEGLCFLTKKKVNKGDILSLNLYIPGSQDPIPMEGVVRWVLPFPGANEKNEFCIGVQLTTVRGAAVEKSIFIDHIHNVVWSIVLEAIFGTFKELALRVKNLPKK